MTKHKGLWGSLRLAALALVGAVALGAMAPDYDVDKAWKVIPVAVP